MSLRRARVQKFVGHLCWLPLSSWIIAYLKFFARYEIESHAALRAQYKELLKSPEPLIICSNHLTYIDSVLIIYALGNHFWYFTNFRGMTWNLPAIEYSKNPFFRFICYIDKCLFIDRKGKRDKVEEVLDTATALLRQGEPVTVFPEGRRSRTGRFDSGKLAYGIGRMVLDLGGCRVLCLYLRGDLQTGPSKFPAWKNRFSVRTELLTFSRSHANLQNPVAITREIAATIAKLEERHFAAQKT